MAAAKIMLVDDNEEFLGELGETLYLCGYNPITVAQSRDALKVARRKKPDVILLDLKMKHKSGFDLAQDLKQDQETRGIPIIAMSGYFPVDRRSVLLDVSNMDASIKKPFSVIDLISHIERVLGGREGFMALDEARMAA